MVLTLLNSELARVAVRGEKGLERVGIGDSLDGFKNVLLSRLCLVFFCFLGREGDKSDGLRTFTRQRFSATWFSLVRPC